VIKGEALNLHFKCRLLPTNQSKHTRSRSHEAPRSVALKQFECGTLIMQGPLRIWTILGVLTCPFFIRRPGKTGLSWNVMLCWCLEFLMLCLILFSILASDAQNVRAKWDQCDSACYLTGREKLLARDLNFALLIRNLINYANPKKKNQKFENCGSCGTF
jgi:hypothetical protein